MQIKFKLLFTFAALLTIVSIDVAQSQWTAIGYYRNDAHPGKCYISETLILSPGESAKPPGECSQMSCSGEDGLVNIIGCGLVVPPPNCEWGDYIDVEAPYPECCAQRLICNNPANQTMAAEFEAQNLEMFRGVREQDDAERAANAAVLQKEL